MKTFSLVCSLIAALGAAGCASAAKQQITKQDTERTPASSRSNSGAAIVDRPMQTIGEVFLKGSIDGKHLFMVLGVKDALKADKKIAEWAVDEKDLKDLADDVYNPEHHDDAVSRVRKGAEISKEAAPMILSLPWKSLQKIPKAYRVDFDHAQNAYYSSKNPVSGVLKYSGWAVWANIQGAYYLVIETPIEFVGMTLATVGAVPAAAVWEGLVVVGDAGKIVFKYASGAIAVLAVDAYSLVSATTATTLTAVTASGIGIYKGAKFLFYGLPHRMTYPVAIEQKTDFAMSHQEEIARIAQSVIVKEMPQVKVRGQIGKYKSTFTLSVADRDGTEAKMGRVLVGVKRDNVVIKVEFKRSYLKSRMAQENADKTNVKQALFEEGEKLIDSIQAEIKRPQ